MSQSSIPSFMLSVVVEIVAGVAMIIIGVILQVNGSSGDSPNPTLTVTGGVLVAIGGVLLSWMASRILSDRQREESQENAKNEAENAVQVAHTEIDEKLNNLSRVLGQAAGQIAQTVEKFDMGAISKKTGFELISQANRMIYGQVNEIAVIRKSQFDSAYLLDTATSLDKLGRELASRSDNGQQDSAGLEKLREEIGDVIQGLTSSDVREPRASGKVRTTCPYCETQVHVLVGATPGDTAIETCPDCGEVFNVHRNSAGAGFTRKYGPKKTEVTLKPTYLRWKFSCSSCSASLFTPQNGKGERLMVCPTCFYALKVNPLTESINPIGQLEKVEALDAHRSGSRPKAPCPKCNDAINMPIRYHEGYFGFCIEDSVALFVTDKAWEEIKN